jgi:hypothetical protein
MPYDADQIANLEDELDALISPTTEEVLAHSQDYDAGIVAASAARRALSGGGGGSQTQTLTVTVTTDSVTFEGSHVFDLDPLEFANVYLTLTVLALDGDGETWGLDPGEIYVRVPIDTDLSQISPDGITYHDWETVMWGGNSSRALTTVSQQEWILGLSVRFMLQGFFIADSDDATKYAGANNPTATIQMDLTYR